MLFAMYSAGSDDHFMMSIFSVFNSATTFSTRMPRGPTHEPTASIIGVGREHGHLRADPGLARDRLDLHDAGHEPGTSISNRRLTSPGLRARDEYLRAAAHARDFEHVDLDAVGDVQVLARHLLVRLDDALGAAEFDIHLPVLDALHDGGQDLVAPSDCTRRRSTPRSASRRCWTTTCLAVCAAIRPKLRG